MRQTKALATIVALLFVFWAAVVGVCVSFFLAVRWASTALAF